MRRMLGGMLDSISYIILLSSIDGVEVKAERVGGSYSTNIDTDIYLHQCFLQLDRPFPGLSKDLFAVLVALYYNRNKDQQGKRLTFGMCHLCLTVSS